MLNVNMVWCIVLCAYINTQSVWTRYVSDQRTTSKWTENREIQIFREYLQIPTVHPNVDYRPAVAFLRKQAANLDLPIDIYYPVDNDNPVVVMTWKGSQPELRTIMLNSHMDVVPVFEKYWKHPPFAAEIEANGDIYARGAQDTKCIGTQYLAAIRTLKRNGINQLKRTIYIVFVPDEELGGNRGMGGFVKTNIFKKMNVVFMLDEGSVADENGVLPVSYVQRTTLLTEFIFHGRSGHASMLFDNTPGEKLNYVLNKLYEYRAEEKRKVDELKYPLGNVTSINLTKLNGGIANNVIPAELSATVDIRVSVNTDVDAIQQQLKRWCDEAGGGITLKSRARGMNQKATIVDDTNPYWVAFKHGVTEAGIKIKPFISPASSDIKHINCNPNFHISALGFAPKINTIDRFHDHNEYLNADVYLNGIEIYKKIIVHIANV